MHAESKRVGGTFMLDFIYFTFYLFVFLVGIVIGSFLNVVIYRVPNGISVAKGRSYCPCCKQSIKSYDLVPVLSYVILGGKCRACKAKISLRYPLIELITGLLAIMIVYVNGFQISSLLIFLTAAILIPISMVDFDTMTIPDSLIISLIPIAIAFAVLEPNLISRVIGFFAISLPMYASLYLIEDGFGGGDIKLFAVCGFILGWEKLLLAFFIAIISGAFVGVALSLIKKENRKGKHIPFGPYICIGIFAAMLFGTELIHWYLSLFSI